jgi:uncharacterized protein involved in cysteine biosynthesis
MRTLPTIRAMPTTPLAPPCPACGYPFAEPACTRCHGRVVDPNTAEPVRAARGFFLFDIAHGFGALIRGSLLIFLAPPFHGRLSLAVLINVVVVVAVALGFFFGIHAAFAELVEMDWGFLSFLRTPIDFAKPVLAFVLALLTLWLLAPTVIVLVTSPFLDGIADITEKLSGGDDMTRLPTPISREIFDSVSTATQILALQIALWVPVLLLSFCGIGAWIAFVVSAGFAGLAWLEIPCVRRHESMRRRIQLAKRNWAKLLGFGIAVQIGMLVPLYNLLLLTPSAAAGAVLLYFAFDKSDGIARLPDATPRG